jgi:RNA polymerase sigma-70 factor (ECF subfamily)
MRMLGQGAAAHGDVEQIVATNEALAETLRVLAKLKPRDRRLVALRVAAGLSNREVAEVMNLSEGTVGVAMHRALERFRALRAAARIEEGG